MRQLTGNDKKQEINKGVFETDMEGFPKKWVLTPLSNIASLINGRAFKPEDWSVKGLPIVRIQNLNDHSKPFNYCIFEVDEKFLIENGQLLFAWSGTPGTSFGCFIWNRGKAVLNQHIFKIVIDEKHLNKQFICYAINQNLDKYINKAHGGVGLRHITKGKFEEEIISIPPLNEQKRIVAKIASIFAQIDAAKRQLERLTSQVTSASGSLAQLKSSVLKQAFEGKLVSQDLNDEPAEVLLKKLHKNSEKELKFDKKGMPEGWIKTILKNVVDNVYKIDPKETPDKRYYYCDINSIDNSRLKITNPKQIFGKLAPSRARQLIRTHDILFSTVRTYLRNIAIVPDDLDGQLASTGFCVIRSKIYNKFVFYYVQENIFLDSLTRIQRGTSYPAVRNNDVLHNVIPLPPFSEQHRIVSKIESIFGKIDAKFVIRKITYRVRIFVFLYFYT